MKKILLIIILLTLGCSRQVLNLRSNNPVTEPNTGILFPSNLCNIPKLEMAVYPQKELGVSFYYQDDDLIKLTFYVYNAGLSTIADGIESDEIQAYFKQSIDDLYTMQKIGKYYNVAEVKQIRMDFQIKSTKLPALFAQFDLTSQNLDRGSFLMMTGYKNQIIKVRYTFPKELEEIATAKWECILKSFEDDNSIAIKESSENSIILANQVIYGEVNEISIAPDTSIWFPSKSGMVYRITDMQNVEIKLKLPEPQPDYFGQKKINIDHITFFDINRVFISGYLGEDLVGKKRASTDKIFVSNNAGKEWTMKTFSEPGEWIYDAIANADGNSWMGGSNGSIYHSADFGQSWEKISSPFNSSDRLACLFAVDSIGVVGALHNVLKITTDNFNTFKKIETPYNKKKNLFTSIEGKNGDDSPRFFKVMFFNNYLIVDQAHIVFFKLLADEDWHVIEPLLVSFDIDIANNRVVGVTTKNEIVELASNFKDYKTIGNIKNDEKLLDLKCQHGITYLLTASYHPEKKDDGLMGSMKGMAIVRQDYRRVKAYCFYKVTNGSTVKLELQAQDQSP